MRENNEAAGQKDTKANNEAAGCCHCLKINWTGGTPPYSRAARVLP